MIDLYGSTRAYLDHLGPVWQALPTEERGTVTVPWHLSAYAAQLGLGPQRGEQGNPGPGPGTNPVMIAGYVDHRACRWQGRQTVWLAHGCGQCYDGDPASVRMSGYPGGTGHEDCLLFMEAGERAAARWREFYPDVPALAVGAPKLDALHTEPRRARARTLSGAVVGFAWHWDCSLVPESRSAWRHYVDGMPAVLAELQAAGAHAAGHGHPREADRWARKWQRLGVEPVTDWCEMLRRADVLCVDNSSLGPEAGSVGVPLVWLDCPWYRRDVWHDGRFWRWTENQAHATGPGGLVAAIEAALADPPEWQAGRTAMVNDCYVACDGHAAERAAAAIVDVIG